MEVSFPIGHLFGFVHIERKWNRMPKRAIKIAAYFHTIEWFPLLFKVTQCFPEIGQYKNAFQQDAYRPLFTVRGLCAGGLCPEEGLCPEGCLSRGVSVQRSPSHSGGSMSGDSETPDRDAPVNRITGRCKNITLPETSFADGKNEDFKTRWTFCNRCMSLLFSRWFDWPQLEDPWGDLS